MLTLPEIETVCVHFYWVKKVLKYYNGVFM